MKVVIFAALLYFTATWLCGCERRAPTPDIDTSTPLGALYDINAGNSASYEDCLKSGNIPIQQGSRGYCIKVVTAIDVLKPPAADPLPKATTSLTDCPLCDASMLHTQRVIELAEGQIGNWGKQIGFCAHTDAAAKHFKIGRCPAGGDYP